MLGHTRWASVGIISEPNAHPLDSVELATAVGDGGPYVTAVLNGDVDNFADLKATEGLRIAPEITTDAKVIPTLVSRRLADGARPARRLPQHRRRARGLGRHRRRSPPTAPDQPAARAAGQRPGALRRPGRGHLHRGQRALRRGRGDQHLPAPRRRDPGQPREPHRQPGPDRRARRRRRRHDRGHRPGRLRRHRAARSPPTSWPRPRSPPATSTGATSRTSCSRRSPRPRRRSARRSAAARRRRRRGCGVELGDDTLPADAAGRPATGAIRRVIVIGQGTAAVAGQSLATVLAELAGDRAAGRGRRRPPSCRASTCAPTCPTRSSSPSASRAPPPTPTAPSTWPARGAPPSSPSSTGATATSPTRPTACSTRPTGATWR